MQDIANKLLELPVEQRDAILGELQKLRSCLVAPVPTNAQPADAGLDGHQTKGLTGLFFEHMQAAGLVYEVIRDEAGNIVDWCYQEANNASLHVFGIERSELIGKTARAVFGDDFVNRQLPEVNHVLTIGEPGHFEERYGNGYYLISNFKVNENTVARIAIDITERKRAENEICLVNEALARSEAKYKALEERFSKAFRSSPVALTITRLSDGKFIDVNESHFQISGYTREEVLGHTGAELGLYVDRNERKKIVELLREQGCLRDYEMKTRTKSGKILTVLFSLEPIELDGEACILATMIDITERKQAEILKQAETEINQIIHSTLEFHEIMQRTVTAGAKALQSDTAALSLYKDGCWQISAVYGLPEDTFGLAMDDKQALHGLLAIQTKKPVAVEDVFNDERYNRQHLQAWDIRSVLVVPVLLRDEAIGAIFFNYHQSVFKFQAAHIDFGIKIAASLSLALENSRLYHSLKEEINIRKRAETTLRESEMRERTRATELEMLMDAVPAVIWICHDPDCREIVGNRRSYELLHMPPGGNISKSAPEAELANRHYQFMKDGRPIPAAELPMQIAAATSKPARDYTMDLVFEDGTTYQLIGNVNPLFDQDGKPAGAIGAFVDITRQFQLENQHMEFRTQMEIHHRLMDQREKDRQAIARDIHDGPVQTLSSTLFNIQFAKEVIADPQFRIEIEQIAINVKNAVQELRQVIYELRPPSVIRFGITQAIRFHAEDLREKYPELQLTLHLADDQNRLSEITCLTLYRIYQEAITNVIRHSGATQAWVRFSLQKDNLVLEIRDNGKGFLPVDNFGSLTEQGHFGLAGIKERVEVINGKLKITSDPEKGTILLVKAPIQHIL